MLCPWLGAQGRFGLGDMSHGLGLVLGVVAPGHG